MGTDIHGVWQVNDGDVWVDIPHPDEWDQQRRYQLFAVLAGVRNGHGFGGIVTGDAVAPIAEPRGLPEDFEVTQSMRHPTVPTALHPWGRRYALQYPEEPCTEWMGYHDFSWLAADEMIAWYEKAPVIRRCGVVDLATYYAWDRTDDPDEYCGDICGRSIHVCEEKALADTPGATHVRVWWEVSLAKDLKDFFEMVRALRDKYPGQKVRFVFGFDS